MGKRCLEYSFDCTKAEISSTNDKWCSTLSLTFFDGRLDRDRLRKSARRFIVEWHRERRDQPTIPSHNRAQQGTRQNNATDQGTVGQVKSNTVVATIFDAQILGDRGTVPRLNTDVNNLDSPLAGRYVVFGNGFISSSSMGQTAPQSWP
jgi:hypothetical protein